MSIGIPNSLSAKTGIDDDIYGPPCESTAPSMDGKLTAIFEDLLDYKLQLLQDRLLEELVGIRTDLCAKLPGQHTAFISEGASCFKSSNAHGQHSSEAYQKLQTGHQDLAGLKNLPADDNHCKQQPLAAKKQSVLPSQESQHAKALLNHYKRQSFHAQESQHAGVQGLVTIEGTEHDFDSVRARPRKMLAKFQLRNELAAMRKEQLVYGIGMLSKLQLFVDWWQDLNEPERKGWVAGLVGTRAFEGGCILVILVNSVFIAAAADWEIRHTGQTKPVVFLYAEIACSCYFIIELVLRLSVHRLYFFVNDGMKINCFDFSIVVLGCLDLMVTVTYETSKSSASDQFTLGRMARLLKLSKMFRTMRALRFFKDLVVIMESLANSFAALFWILVFLGLVLFIFALVFVQGTIDYLQSMEGRLDEQEVNNIKKYFGSMLASITSMYGAVTGGNDWMTYYEIVAKFGALYAAMFMGFMFFFIFAMFNILTGIFVEKAAVASKPDVDQIILAEKQKLVEQHNELHSIFVLLDEEKTDRLSWEDFDRLMTNPTLVACMSSIGLEVHEPELFFEMICDDFGESTIPIDLFVDRCMKMKGSATGIDVQRSLFELCQLRRQLESLAAAIFPASFERQPTQGVPSVCSSQSLPFCRHAEAPPEPPVVQRSLSRSCQ